jgi:hypothetical protein
MWPHRDSRGDSQGISPEAETAQARTSNAKMCPDVDVL